MNLSSCPRTALTIGSRRCPTLGNQCRRQNQCNDCHPRLLAMRLQLLRRRLAWHAKALAERRPCDAPRAFDLALGSVFKLIVVMSSLLGACVVSVVSFLKALPRTQITRHATNLSTSQSAASFKLMCTCLVSRYSSMPHGPEFPSEARLLVSAPWRLDVSRLHVIDPNDAHAQRFHTRKALKMSRVHTAAAKP